MVYGSGIPRGGQMLKRFIILFLLTNFVFAGLMAYQKYLQEPEERYSRQAERGAEVLGYWRSVPLPDDMRQKLNTNDPSPSTPYHAVAINEDGRLREIRSSAPFGQNLADLKKLLNRIKSPSTWEFADGVLTVKPAEQGHVQEKWSVFLVTKPHEKANFVVQPGDMLMLLQDPKGVPVFYRHMRRVGE